MKLPTIKTFAIYSSYFMQVFSIECNLASLNKSIADAYN